jgi:protease-4
MRRFFTAWMRWTDITRRVLLNVLFTLVLIVMLLVLLGQRAQAPQALEEKTTLVLELKGSLVDQNTHPKSDLALQALQDDGPKELQLRDLMTVLDAAAKDPLVGSAVLLLDDFHGAGPALLREAAASLEIFRHSGKKVVAWGSSFNQKQYFLAAHADEVYLHPHGMVAFTGYGGYRNYYRDALERLGIGFQVVKAGTYKSFAEPFEANAPSKPAMEAESFVMGALWDLYTQTIEKSRKLQPGSLMQGINQLPDKLAEVQGDLAALALKERLVDGLKTRDELRAMLIERGAPDEANHTFRQVHFKDYLSRQPASPAHEPAIGVVVAQGTIESGEASAGAVGGLSTAQLIRRAREDQRIKSVVLRVNSPGGSAFGSELIRRELELTRKAGKPVVVSMSDLAASGGYWVATSADEVLADSATITGSIGVIGMFPTVNQMMNKLSIHTHGQTTTWLGRAQDPRLPTDPRMVEVLQSVINHHYRNFTGLVAKARQTTPEAIDAVAQGRIWTGAQAHERKLVDRLGSYRDALSSAARLAKLPEKAPVVYVEHQPTPWEIFLKLMREGAIGAAAQEAARALLAQMLGWAMLTDAAAPAAVADPAWVALPLLASGPQLQADVAWLVSLHQRMKTGMPVSDPLAHCMCTAP